MTYRINGVKVTKDEFLASAPEIDWSAPTHTIIATDYSAYECPVTGRMIEGRAAHRENLKQHGCRLLEKGEREHNQRTRAENVERSAAQTARRIAERLSQQWAG